MLRRICACLLIGLAGQLQVQQAASAELKVFRNLTEHLDYAQTLDGIGAAQGATCFQGRVYIYGDAETGVIREYRYDSQGQGELVWTGLEIRLTRHGEDVVPPPTGLTFGPQGVFLGDTVLRKGTIFQIDWQKAKQDGNLDHAIINQINDDLAINGTRPEYVRFQGRDLIATSDYGPDGNEIRLYDPQRLGVVARTSAAGVLVEKRPAGPWVQSLCYWEKGNRLILVQNQTEGLGYQLTAVSLDECTETQLCGETIKLAFPKDELEGFEVLPDGRALFLSSSRERNVWITELTPSNSQSIGDVTDESQTTRR